MTRLEYRPPGRPPGPSAARLETPHRPWDPRRLTRRDQQALSHIAASPDMPRWMIADAMGISPSRLAILACSPLGQAFIARLTLETPDDP